MMHSALFTVLFLLQVLWMASPAEAGYTLIQQPAANDPMQVHIYELDNGLQVYLTANREEPRFYAEIIVRAGSKHDPKDATGIAHYLEHMLFKGSRQLGTLDFEAEKEHLDRIEALYEEHFSETDPERRIALYAQINEANQRAA
ncbi:MAG: insulinase family protein, partial [Candidatus Latescibacterota bacterium]|nr:insulinase family protein [Candidatus Latescibacterota bacterium]